MQRGWWLSGLLLCAACGGSADSSQDGVRADGGVDASVFDTPEDPTDTASSEDAALPDEAGKPVSCLASGSACTSGEACCSRACVASKCATLGASTLDDDRERLLETFARVQGLADRCAAWSKLDDVQKGLFLTHTDLLGNRSCFGAAKCAPGDEQALRHVFKLWAINGSDPGCACTKTTTGYKCCNGGAEWHRSYFSADDALMQAMRSRVSLPEWGASKDLAGPHDPFTQSNETSSGQPTGQIHFWAKDADASTLKRTGVVGVDDPHLVELDNDYNLLHDSNPEGCYGVFGLGCSYGRVAFKKTWSAKGNAAATTFRGNGEPSSIAELAGDAVWSPRCPTALLASAIRSGATLTLAGTGLSSGVVHVRTRAGELVLPSSSATTTEVTLALPTTPLSGEAYAWVVVGGVMSNVVPFTL